MTTPSNKTEPPGPDQPRAATGGLARHLLFGIALVLAFASMYAGVLGWGRSYQYALAVAALVIVLMALTKGTGKPQQGNGTG
jgi:hypothetical protein